MKASRRTNAATRQPTPGELNAAKVRYPRVSRGGLLANLLLGVSALAMGIPLLWMILASIDRHAGWGIHLPDPTVANYSALMNRQELHPFYNSFYLAGVSTVLTLVLGMPAGYALSRWKLPLKQSLLLVILFASGLPVTMTLVATYELYTKLHMLNSLFYTSLFLTAAALPFAVWLLKNFIDAVPLEFEEAASIEGSGAFSTLCRIVVPLALPGIAVTTIITFIGGWGAFMIPLILDAKPSHLPGSLAIYQFMSANTQIKFGGIAAYSMLFSAPVVALYLLSSKYLGRAFTFGGGIRG